ncbi:hypothetical protein RSOLAG1IB_03575 [Rhizoctonia solani AG-1 IB]|uniref:Uncharacterized protein n=1 Tax=Thanatephorus cucumeris (strain AG1-IB / isolate 7/3/14) TaxID=1108050 RepID=A0A0B7FTZ3_THACB|nr:hypothetical protein RSOLAG1IB_03575 [Rhizoctonia solani AG-1 IB]
MNFTTRSSYFGEASSGGNYQLLSAYEASSSYKNEDYPIRPSPIRRHSTRNLLLKPDRRKKCSNSTCVCMASPTTPRSLLPKGEVCECALDSLPYLPRDSSHVLPQDLYSALEELELETSCKDFQSRGQRPMRASIRHVSEGTPNGTSPHSRLLRRLKIPSSGRRGPRSDHSVMMDPDLSPASSTSSSRYGSPVPRRSPTPFTPRNAEAETPDFYHMQHFDQSFHGQSIDLDEDMIPKGTEPSGQEGREQGINGGDPMAMRFKLPDPRLGPNPRKYSRFP